MQSKYNPCPFCGSFPNVELDSSSGQYKVECKKCKEKNIQLICFGDTIQSAINTWNNLYNQKEEILTGKELVLEKANPTKIEVQDSYGFLIFADGEILICDMYDHQAIIMNRFNIKEDNFDHAKYCGENGIVRISISNKSLAVDLPIIMTKKQKDNIFEALAVYPGLKDIHKFSIFSYKTKQYLIFYTLNELLEALDNAK